MRASFLSLLALPVLAACAYTMDGMNQELTVETPGAHDALCYVYADNLKYKLRPPGTITIIKSEKDLVVDCLAPGNRQRKVIVAARRHSSASMNLLNAGVGMVWDNASGAMYYYPERIEVNFENMPVRSSDLPAQNNPDIDPPESYLLEEFVPGSPRMNSDRNQKPVELKRRERPSQGAEAYNPEVTYTDSVVLEDDPGGALPSGKGVLMPASPVSGGATLDAPATDESE